MRARGQCDIGHGVAQKDLSSQYGYSKQSVHGIIPIYVRLQSAQSIIHNTFSNMDLMNLARVECVAFRYALEACLHAPHATTCTEQSPSGVFVRPTAPCPRNAQERVVAQSELSRVKGLWGILIPTIVYPPCNPLYSSLLWGMVILQMEHFEDPRNCSVGMTLMPRRKIPS